MKTALLLLLGITFSSLHAQQTNESLVVNGVNRSFIQYLPNGFNPNTETLPVVYILHGLGGTASQMVGAGFNFVADTARVIVVYPQAVNNQFGSAAWNNGTIAASNADDISFFNALMDRYILNFNANASRQYVTGFSMGGIMSHHLACALNNRVAAIGPMAGTMPTNDISSCVPVYKTPVIHLHGTADATVPYDSNPVPTISLVPETINFWRTVHNCASTYDSIAQPNTAADGITVDQFVYQNCDNAGALELWRLNGAGHIYLYQPVNDITEMREIWRFFRKWTHNSPAAAGISGLNANPLAVYPNPAKHYVNLQKNGNHEFLLLDLTGQVVRSGAFLDEITIHLEDIHPGIYFIQIDQETTVSKILVE